MIQDVYDPLEKYRDEFKENFSRLAREKFEELAEKSGVDISANRKTIKELKSAEETARAEKTKLFFKGLLIFALIAGAAAAGYFAYSRGATQQGVLSGAACAACLVCLYFAFKFYSKTSKFIDELKFKIRMLERVAWAQMQPLNELYTWDIPVKLIEKTVPRLAFDPYFTASRLSDLKRQFGWSDSFNEGKSILFAQSGAINGNAFALGEYVEQKWGSKTYYGYKTIHWTEWQTGSDGKRHLVSRSQTLKAELTKPIPIYPKEKILIYGNDAAPNLSFSRKPSSLSNGSGMINSMRKKMELRRLKKFSQNLDDDSQYTLMSNHEFETLFHAKDRTNEVEFRLLFTALAQTQILRLMKDTSIGYGDDFAFTKRGKINMLFPAHLTGAPIDTDPARFRSFDFDAAKSFFLSFNEKYFKDVYFAFAPILSIPLYQQTRTHEDIYKEATGAAASFWELEAIANFHGEEKFRHPQSATQAILKASRVGGEGEVEITAYSYKGERRVEYVSVFGGDGRLHSVAVEWVEYLPISKTSKISVSEAAGNQAPPKKFAGRSILRRGIYSMLG
ncbi:MAG: hypothetical protein IKS15_03645 [Opitutales bacterium]|nr:hypothetical protein [Opitutales bacterium]